MCGVIYRVTSPSGKIYIGQTIQSLSRRKQGHHYSAFRKGRVEYNYPISRAIRKYGDNLEWIILYNNIPVGQLDNMEQWCISNYNTYYEGYNSTLGGHGSRGVVVSAKTKKKMSEAKLGSKNHFYGKYHSDKAKKKIGEASKGRIPSKETRKKLSDTRIGEKNSRAILSRKKAKEIRKKRDTGKYTLKELATEYGVSEGTIGDITKYRSWNK